MNYKENHYLFSIAVVQWTAIEKNLTKIIVCLLMYTRKKLYVSMVIRNAAVNHHDWIILHIHQMLNNLRLKTVWIGFR